MRRLVLLGICLVFAISLGFGETVDGEDRAQALQPTLDVERTLLEASMSRRLAFAGEGYVATLDVMELMLRRTAPPQDEGERARDFLHRLRLRASGFDDAVMPALPGERDTGPLSAADAVRLAAIEQVYRSLETAGSRCCPCSSDAACSDNLFCNGAEVCSANQCTAGPAPCPGDGDACTIDSCSESMNQCYYDPVPAPPAPGQLLLDAGSGPGSALLSWDAVSGADAYNLYAGGFSDLSDLTCILPGLTSTSVEDSSTPAPLLIYLVSSDACSESDLGDSSSGPRVAPAVCP